jgi:hypothetical protein
MKINPFKVMKYLEMNLTTVVNDLCYKNYKSEERKLKKALEDRWPPMFMDWQN